MYSSRHSSRQSSSTPPVAWGKYLVLFKTKVTPDTPARARTNSAALERNLWVPPFRWRLHFQQGRQVALCLRRFARCSSPLRLYEAVRSESSSWKKEKKKGGAASAPNMGTTSVISCRAPQISAHLRRGKRGREERPGALILDDTTLSGSGGRMHHLTQES